MNKNKILSGGGKKPDRGREVGLEGEGSGGRGEGSGVKGGGKWGERGREVGIGYPPVHPLILDNGPFRRLNDYQCFYV